MQFIHICTFPSKKEKEQTRPHSIVQQILKSKPLYRSAVEAYQHFFRKLLLISAPETKRAEYSILSATRACCRNLLAPQRERVSHRQKGWEDDKSSGGRRFLMLMLLGRGRKGLCFAFGSFLKSGTKKIPTRWPADFVGKKVVQRNAHELP
ncbi:hypothetical protein NPIL_134891 [Nephila pilipes]|uniref:Uncharacterized protein n=1 Tax=Nephila pilipes TaxID=299642 RepID=A0A8X6P3A1_NEPPI|nr:hypothetical protein NPIL_134891 [Nephila pilipes]